MSRAVFAIAGIALASAAGAPAAAEEKSSKPRIAVIELKNQAHAQLELDSSQWGEWVAGVERPRARGSVGANEKITISSGRTESGGGTNEMSMDDTAGKEKKPAAPTPISHDLRTNVIARTAPPASGGDPDRPVIAGTVPNASAAATGKRQHMPIRIRTFAAPQPRGSVILGLKRPWPDCAVGDRFDGVFVMTGATHGYRLGGAEVARCDGSAVTINYTMFAAEGTPTR